MHNTELNKPFLHEKNQRFQRRKSANFQMTYTSSPILFSLSPHVSIINVKYPKPLCYRYFRALTTKHIFILCLRNCPILIVIRHMGLEPALVSDEKSSYINVCVQSFLTITQSSCITTESSRSITPRPRPLRDNHGKRG